jgi:hypothetical protein
MARAGLCIALAMLGGIAQEPRATQVNGVFDTLEKDFLERLDVSESLKPGREDLGLLVRRDATIGRSWQLEPSAAESLTTDEIFQFVVARGNALLTCSVAQLARKRLDAPSGSPAGRNAGAARNTAARGAEPGATTALSAQVESSSGAAIMQKLWKDDSTEGKFRLSPGCNVLLDEAGQPATLTTKADVSASNSLMNRSLRFASRKQLFEAALEPRFQKDADAILRANVDYLKRQYGGPPEREPEVEAILGRKEWQVFSRQVLMFEAFIASNGNMTRLILVVPLSE